ncbi:PAS domain-containing protein [Foetidibacter luteolus]|uniref:PAS domain-containing protein n=1 Tax=Foetidibacter luteolus TaxID=2608880 RepID=UPI00129B4998|nr:PAS domain-containing protein [Foetidibacter luteolus]
MITSIYPKNQTPLNNYAEPFADAVFAVTAKAGAGFEIVHASQSFLNMVNLHYNHVIHNEIANVLPPEDAYILNARLQECTAGNNITNFKYVSHLRGKNACMAVQIFPSATVPGGNKQLVCVLKDVTGADCDQNDRVNGKLLMQRIYDFFPEGIVISDDNGFIIECNTASQELFGISREESSYMTVREKLENIEIVHTDHTPIEPAEFPSAAALEQKTVIKNVTLGLNRKNQDTAWVNISAAYLNLPGYGVVTSYTDITKQKQQEENTNALKKTLDAILNCSSDCILFLDTSLRIVLCNPKARQFGISLLGREVKEGEYVISLLEACSRKEVIMACLHKVQNREEVFAEEKLQFLNGEEKWYYIKFYPTYDEKGAYTGCVLNYTDITERKENELRLRLQNEQLKAQEVLISKNKKQFENLINSSSDFILLLDADMQVVLYNDEVRRTAVKYLGKADYDVLSPMDLPEVNRENLKTCIQKVIETRKPVFRETSLTLATKTLQLYSKYFPVFDENGNYAGCTMIVTDITSIKEKELQIQEQNRQLKALVEVEEKQKEELRATRNILQTAINSSSDIIAFIDTDHKKVFCNRASETFAMKYWGRIVTEGDYLFDFMPKTLHRQVNESLEIAKHNKVVNLEKKFRMPGGATAWYSIRIFPTIDARGAYIGSFINVCDITQRKSAELKLQQQNEELKQKTAVIKETKKQLESLINSSSDYILLLDTQMRVVLFNSTANEAALTYLGKPYTKGANLLDFLPEENRAPAADFINEVQRTGKSVFVESKLNLAHDLRRWLYNKFFPVYDENGNYSGCTVIATDITSIKLKEYQIEHQNQLLKELIEVSRNQNEQLRQNEMLIRETINQLEAVINSSSDNILFINTDNKVIFYNKAATHHFLKLSNKALQQGANILDYMPQDSIEIFKQNLQNLQEKQSVELEQQVFYPDGDKIWFHRKFYPVYNEKDNYIGYVINSSNIDKRKLFEIKLSRQNEQLREIARIQSHELRRPLANILGLISLLTEDPGIENEDSELLGKLKLSAEELDEVIRRITGKTLPVN